MEQVTSGCFGENILGILKERNLGLVVFQQYIQVTQMAVYIFHEDT